MHRTQRIGTRIAVVGSLIGGLGLSGLAHAQSITVQGNSRVEADVVRSYFPSTDAAGVAAGEKALRASGLFSSVRVSRRGSSVVVNVAENNVINNVAFEGNSKVKGDQLRPEMQLRSRGPFSPSVAASDVERIREIYRRSGRAAAKVSYRTVNLPNGRIDVVYTIDEGDKTGVKVINFSGNQAYSSGKLIGLMQTTEMNFLSFLKNTDVYDPDRISSDLELIRRYYLKNGYADFQVVRNEAHFDAAQGGYIVNIAVNEGPQYRVSNVSVQSSLRDVPGDSLMPLVRLSAGQVYNGDAVEKTVEALTKALARRGYAFAQVRPRGNRNAAAQTVSIDFVIDEGPRVYVERINVRGNTRTRDYVVRREFEIGEGDAYNRVLIDRAERRLNNLGYFKKVRITNEPGTAPDRVVINVEVEDQPTGNFSVSGGYSTSDGFIAEVSVSESNFMGRGQYVRAAATLGQRTKGLEFNFTEPYFLDTRVAVGFDLYVKKNTTSRYSVYNTTTVGGTLRAAIPITDEITVAPRYSIYSTYLSIPNDLKHPYNDCSYPIPGITPGPTGFMPASIFYNCATNGEASIAIKAQQGTTITSMFGYTVAYSTLNNPKKPTDGVYASLNLDVAGAGGDPRFIRTTGEARYYHEIFDNVVAFARIQGGAMSAYGGYKLRVTDQFNPGPALVRGFAPGGIGPRDISNPFNYKGNGLGGSKYIGASVEAQFPIFGMPRELGLKGAVFADAGTVWGYSGRTNFTTVQDAILYGYSPAIAGVGCIPAYSGPWFGPGTCLQVGGDTKKIRTSVGASLLWDSPMGPIRFDFAKALSKSPYDQTQFFRFSGGGSF
ncbi:MAG TPA: outer membrane protein assembly factor BamA [Beijerinckiaceae bacterium]|nr:outer membrane protein assembly factor BamA [Hyphomicrobiales bacterium]HRY02239.1 outer membrane protein assembly factor BamA [Beijerinckiaceae bacterium]